jgi:outer membrane protein assembly factor BamD
MLPHLNRAKNIYINYPDSIHVKEALVIQYIAYKELKLKDLEMSTKKIIDLTFLRKKLHQTMLRKIKMVGVLEKFN